LQHQVRERFFTPRLRFRTYDELNGWLLDQCVTYAKAHPHPERRFGPDGTGIAERGPTARLRPPRRRTTSRSCR
jgi:hypothetical protein